uniref:NADH-ubiquinone oxidoreductase chain 2 n=1 Tax=Paracoccidioides brasiliensis (strain Pb18) TaxID=502780 RepID=Q1XAA5_PARBD|nr:NADH dehydrogenase subunit 2 [Paracoccidioides brasiliensis]AAY30327.1 NADH dehydrogenase subunit 2 [Paracoccidioides brasiliensis]
MLLISLISLLLSNSLSLRREISMFNSRIGINILLYSILLSFTNLYLNYLDFNLSLFNGLFNISSLTNIFQILILFLTLIILNLTSFYPFKILKSSSLTLNKYRKEYFKLIKQREEFKIIEYTLIILFIIMGSLLLLASNDLISIYLALELQSLGLYILCTIYRNSESSTSSGLTYFLLGSLSSSFILLGISFIYVNSGTTSLDNLYIITNISNLSTFNSSTSLSFSLLLISIGFLFKISAAPFHFWSPDVYDGIPTIVTTFVSIIPKISILIILFYLIYFTNNIILFSEYSWNYSLLISSLLSLIIGTLLGLTQYRIKKLMAYSTISHLGFILLSLNINTMESIQSFIFYLLQYSFSALNVFFILISIGYSFSFFYYKKVWENYQIKINLIDEKNSPLQLLSQIKGYFYLNKILALSLSITLFSFAGIPPLIGFFAKLMVLSSALQNGYFFLSLLAVLSSVLGAVYYLNLVKLMFFETHSYELKHLHLKPEIFYFSSSLSFIISLFTLIILLFIFLPDQLLQLSNILSLCFVTA